MGRSSLTLHRREPGWYWVGDYPLRIFRNHMTPATWCLSMHARRDDDAARRWRDRNQDLLFAQYRTRREALDHLQAVLDLDPLHISQPLPSSALISHAPGVYRASLDSGLFQLTRLSRGWDIERYQDGEWGFYMFADSLWEARMHLSR